MANDSRTAKRNNAFAQMAIETIDKHSFVQFARNSPEWTEISPWSKEMRASYANSKMFYDSLDNTPCFEVRAFRRSSDNVIAFIVLNGYRAEKGLPAPPVEILRILVNEGICRLAEVWFPSTGTKDIIDMAIGVSFSLASNVSCLQIFFVPAQTAADNKWVDRADFLNNDVGLSEYNTLLAKGWQTTASGKVLPDSGTFAVGRFKVNAPGWPPSDRTLQTDPWPSGRPLLESSMNDLRFLSQSQDPLMSMAAMGYNDSPVIDRSSASSHKSRVGKGNTKQWAQARS